MQPKRVNVKQLNETFETAKYVIEMSAKYLFFISILCFGSRSYSIYQMRSEIKFWIILDNETQIINM